MLPNNGPSLTTAECHFFLLMEGDMEITENVRVKAVDILDELTDILAEIGEREYNQQKT